MADPYRLHYEVRGGGGNPDTPLLFLHGFLGSGRDWAETAEAFPDYPCVLVDLPGHGLSAGCPTRLHPMPLAALALLTVLDRLDIEQCVPVGYSMGGRLALWLALSHPRRCRGLVLESASPGIDSERERKRRRKWDESKALRLERQGLHDFLEEWYRQPLFHSIRRNGTRFAAMMERRRRGDPAALARVRGLWQAVGMRVEEMDMRLHDQVLARVSHLPHLIAFSVMNAALANPLPGVDVLAYAGSAFHDLSRVAASPVEMWRDICLENRAALLAAVTEFELALADFKAAIAEADDQTLAEAIAAARTERQRLMRLRERP